jgi:hypothetical protein
MGGRGVTGAAERDTARVRVIAGRRINETRWVNMKTSKFNKNEFRIL